MLCTGAYPASSQARYGRENGASMGRRLLTGPKGPCVIVVVIPGDGPEGPEQEPQQLEHRRSSTDVSHRCFPEFSTGFPHLIHRVANWSLLFWNFSLLVQAVGKATIVLRHRRVCPSHPCSCCCCAAKTGMPGTRRGTTTSCWARSIGAHESSHWGSPDRARHRNRRASRYRRTRSCLVTTRRP